MAATEMVAAGALEGCEVHQLQCLAAEGQSGGSGIALRLSVAPPLDDPDDPEHEVEPYTLYVLDAEPCMFALVVCVVRSLHFYKKVQGGGHFPQILVVGVSHAREVTDDSSWWWRSKQLFGGVMGKFADMLPDAVTDKVESVTDKVVDMLPGALTPAAETSTEPVGDPEPVEDHWSRLKRQRRRDFTPPERGTQPGACFDPDQLTGQAPSFLDALEKEVIPFVESRFNAHKSPQRRCLVGSSLSGLLALQALLRSDTWGAIVAGSPSVWWDDDRILEMVQAAQPGPLGADILITAGSDESERMLANAARLDGALTAKQGVNAGEEASRWRTKNVVLADEDHHTCKAALAGTLVRWIVKIWGHKPSPPEEDENDPWGT
eukprot:jgi/Tetstr1/458837/TSEL_045220.t1